MPNEQLKPKQSASEKITIILNKLSIGEAIDEYNKAGISLHERIEDDRKKLDEYEDNLHKKKPQTPTNL